MIDWRHWHNEPYLVGGLIVVGWLYALLTGPLRAGLAPGQPFPRVQAWQFYAGLVIFYLAVGSPLDQVGERFLFSAHMVQHALIMYPAAALVLLGLPTWLVDAALRSAWVRVPMRLLVHPILAAVIYTLVISVWHAPALYEWALQVKTVHVAEHLTFFAASLLYWWPVLSPSRLLPRLGYGGQMAYLTAVVIAMTPVFAFIAFSTGVLYPTYEFAPRIIAGFDAAEDQLLAAAIMKFCGMGVALLVIAVAFYGWYRQSEGSRTTDRRLRDAPPVAARKRGDQP